MEEGEFFGLLGPNGAGKTTFINVLVGLAKRSDGEARVFGHDAESDYLEARSHVGLSPQEFNVDRFFPIREVLVNVAGYHGIGRGEAGERAEDALRTVELWGRRDTRFHWLSGGMKRRFMLARAMVTDPDLLILDEPTAGVDVELRRDLWRIIRDLNEDGTTVLLTTHYIEEAEKLCERVAILDEGRVVEIDTPGELKGKGCDHVHIELAGEVEEVPDLSGYGVVDWELEDGWVLVRAHHGNSTAPHVLRTLERNGLEVAEVEIHPTSLEEVFVDVTRRGDG